MYNVAEIIVNNIDINQNRKYYYKANFSSAVINIRLYLRNKLKEKELISKIKNFWSHSDQKNHQIYYNKSCKSLNYRTLTTIYYSTKF